QATRFLSHPTATDPDSTRAFLAEAESAWEAGSRFASVLIDRETGQILGMIEARRTGPMLGYGFALTRTAWGRGYMTEALCWHLDHAFTRPEIWRAEALCGVMNHASARVLEKAGMTREGILRRRLPMPNLAPAPQDALLYARTR